MNRKEFMDQLAYLLSDISEEERREALDYYEGYFEEAGKENEEQVIKRLGSPEKVAAEVKSNLYGRMYDENISYTEAGCEDERFRREMKSPERYKGKKEKYSGQSGKFRSWWDGQSNRMRVVRLGIFLAILFSAADGLLGAVFDLAGGMLKMIVGVFGMIFGVFAGMFGIAIAAYATGAGMIGLGIAKIFASPALGLLYCGIGCFGIAFGIVLTILFVWLCSKVIPAIWHIIQSSFGKIFRGRRRAA